MNRVFFGSKLKQIPVYPLIFSIYPGLALAAYNLSEIEARIALRAILVSFLIGGIAFLATRVWLKDWMRAASVTTFFLVLFFSYGHIYQFLEQNPVGNFSLGRHRILIILFAFVFIIGMLLLTRKRINFIPATQALNLACLVLLIMPLAQTATFYFRRLEENNNIDQTSVTQTMLTPDEHTSLPDIYLIVLDTYVRGDALLNDFNFDNTYFLDSLREMGFYVADCARSNYPHTQNALTAMLNMAYIPEISSRLGALGLDPTNVQPLLKQNLVREQLEAIGYKTVAFETGYSWSSITDADIYLHIGSEAMQLQNLTPFEAMFIKTTALLILVDTQNLAHASTMTEVIFPYSDHINRQQFILDQLPKIAALPGANFVFVHILIPHIPYVFDKDGNLPPSDYYNGHNGIPTSGEYLVPAYTGQIQYINSRMIPILQEILDTSPNPPIIILTGDHGLQGSNIHQILNAYYLPADSTEHLYSNISLVNSFRVVFDGYFNTHLGVLTDESFGDGDQGLVPETSPACEP